MTINKYHFLASIDVDAQQCFTPLCPDELPVDNGHKIVDELNKQSKYACLRIGSKDAHSPHALWVAPTKDKIFGKISQDQTNQHTNIDIYWPIHAVPGTRGFELITGLPKPCEYDFFVWKGIEVDMHPYGACYHDLAEQMSTGLIEYLRCNKITHLVVGGLSLDYCVKNTVLQLATAGFIVIVNLAATMGFAKETTLKAQQEMLAKGVLFIKQSKELPGIIN